MLIMESVKVTSFGNSYYFLIEKYHINHNNINPDKKYKLSVEENKDG